MRCRSIITVFALAASVIPFTAMSSAAAGCSTTCQVAPGVQLKDVAFPDATHGWTVGTGGYIAVTADGGLTWQRQSSGVSDDLRAVDFADSQTGVVVGTNEIILRTTDGGESWVRDNAGFGADIKDVEFVDNERGWIVGVERNAPYGNFIAMTGDGGQTWKRQEAPGGLGLTGVSFSDRQHGFAHGAIDPAYRTEDGGATWQPMNVSSSIQFLYAVRRLSADVGIAGGAYGELYRTSDRGLTWSPVARLTRAVRGISVLGSVVMAVGEGGVSSVSLDDGASWTEVASATTANLVGVAVASPVLAVAVGELGFIARLSIGSDQQPPSALDLGDHFSDCVGVKVTRWQRAAGSPNHALVGDLDGSGDPSIVVSSFGGIRALRPFEPQATATEWSLDLAVRVQRTAFAEIDGDLGPEIVAVTAAAPPAREGVIAVDGTTGDVLWSARVAGGSRQIQIADLDGDGLDEIIVGGLGATLYVLDGKTGRLHRPARGLGKIITDIDVGELTGDRRPDIVVSTDDGTTVAINGPTGAKLWEHVASGGTTIAVETADVTGDGIDDVISGGRGIRRSVRSGTADNRLVIGNSSGLLVAALDGRDGDLIWDYGQSTSGEVRALVTGDITGDGTPDVVAHHSRMDAGNLIALDGRGERNITGGTGEPLELWTLPTTYGGSLTNQAASDPDALTLHDGNNDGTPDVYAGLSTGQLLAVSGVAPPPTSLLAPSSKATVLWTSQRGATVRPVPLLEAGGETNVLGLSGDGLVSVLDAATGGTKWSYDAGGSMHAIAADLDGDGRDDVATGSRAGRVAGIDGDDGGPLQGVDAFLPHSVAGVTALDSDGDGIAEVFAADRTESLAAYDAPSGSREWVATTDGRPTSVASGAGIVAVGTRSGGVVGFDATTGTERWSAPVTDGAVNVVAFAETSGLFAAGSSTGQLVILSSGGDFIAARTLPGSVEAVAAIDVDGDGQEDFVAAAGTSLTAVNHTGDVLWSFTGTAPFYRLAAADLTGDGAHDVVAGGQGATVGLTGTTGSLLFERPVLFSAGISGMDLEGDGVVEAVVTSTDRDSYTRLDVVAGDGSPRAACVFDTALGDVVEGDFDGDGHTEVALTTIDGDVYLLEPLTPRTSGTDPPRELSTSLEFSPDSATFGEYSDTVVVAARLIDSDGVPVVGAAVELELRSPSSRRIFRATTDDAGLALRQVPLVDLPGDYTLTARYDGEPHRYLESSAAVAFVIAQERTVLSLTLQGKNNGQRELVALLRDHDNPDNTLSGRTIEFTADGVAIGSATTDAAGIARLTLAGRFRGGKHTYEARFGGDERYIASSDRRES